HVPQLGFYCRQHGDEHSRLGAFKEPASADILKQPVHIERAFVFDAPPEHVDQVVCPGRGVNPFTATPDILVGVNLNKEAVTTPDVSALYVGNLEVAWCGKLGSSVNCSFVALSEGG